jgi:hypothetical protein
MALSPFYGWSEPDNSSLVKNGAADIRTLGDAIDTSLWNVGYGQAGKNKIINGDFGIWQRGTSFTNLTAGSYSADRWIVQTANNTIDVSRSTFSPGTAPVAGYESSFFATIGIDATDTDARFSQRIEDVRTFAGQTITVSFWAKSTITTDAIRFLRLNQTFGSGGSAAVVTQTSAITLTSSWARYAVTVAVPSIAGKTIGTSSFLSIGIDAKVSTAQTLDLWGVQVEYGSIATPFQTATGTIQGELAACQRYYYRNTPGSTFGNVTTSGIVYATTTCFAAIQMPVQMRITPTLMDFGNLQVFDSAITTYAITAAALASTNSGAFIVAVEFTSTGMTIGRTVVVRNANNTAGFLGFSAEL